ncbi:sulfotransferase [Acidithiobacillus sp. VAN18-1]|uniref:Sulfotransferase n=1 Tax=Igneacidithiobacillus copahuensis TaxID=2724909 RepID=A0AAE2YPI2_9PROT|nr:sulfotransferase [Igneacidithiobacillus copahuensis]MBU2787648.1 sulfotransferase [Igneacidithiobacillus copahuensis]MBU2795984.1 sulfotransferase [Acidithiobacillus sp. VAN18-2]
MRDSIWPNFYIVGAVKSGTTSLYAYLRQHPQVFLPNWKEPHFFTQPQPSREQAHLIRYVADAAHYQHLYQGADAFPRIGDASPSYLWCPAAAQRIHQVAPDAKIIVILRDPVERAYAQYLMDFAEGAVHLPFVQALRRDWERPDKGWGISQLYVELGQYSEQIRRYQALFGQDQVLVLLLEDLKKRPRAVLEAVTGFLGIDAGPIAAMDLDKAYNAHRSARGEWVRYLAGSRISRFIGDVVLPRAWGKYIWQHWLLCDHDKPAMDEDARNFLQEIYAPEIVALEQLLGRPLPELRLSWREAPRRPFHEAPVIRQGSSSS